MAAAGSAAVIAGEVVRAALTGMKTGKYNHHVCDALAPIEDEGGEARVGRVNVTLGSGRSIAVRQEVCVPLRTGCVRALTCACTAVAGGRGWRALTRCRSG